MEIYNEFGVIAGSEGDGEAVGIKEEERWQGLLPGATGGWKPLLISHRDVMTCHKSSRTAWSVGMCAHPKLTLRDAAAAAAVAAAGITKGISLHNRNWKTKI